MGSLSDQYRRKMEEAKLAGSTTDNSFMRRAYAKIASHWQELADRVEREEAAQEAIQERADSLARAGKF